MKKLVLLIAFHASACGMESEKIKSREVPSLAELCINAITRASDCDEQSLSHVAYLLSMGSFSPAQKNLLETSYVYLANSTHAKKHYHWVSASTDITNGLPPTSDELAHLIRAQNKPLKVLRVVNTPDTPLNEVFTKFLHGTNAQPGNTLITLPRRDNVSSYLLISGDAHTIIEHVTPTDTRYYPSQEGLITATWTPKRGSLFIEHDRLVGFGDCSRLWSPSWTINAFTPHVPLHIAALPSGSHLHIAQQAEDFCHPVFVIATQDPDGSILHQIPCSKHIDCLLPSLRNPSKSQRVFYSNPEVKEPYVCCSHNRAGSLYAYASRDGSIGVRTYPDGNKILATSTPEFAGIPEAIFFDATDRYLRCLTRRKNSIYLHQFDLVTLRDETARKLSAVYPAHMHIVRTKTENITSNQQRFTSKTLSHIISSIKNARKKVLP